MGRGGLRLEELDLGCFATTLVAPTPLLTIQEGCFSGDHPLRLTVLLLFDIEFLCLFIELGYDVTLGRHLQELPL